LISHECPKVPDKIWISLASLSLSIFVEANEMGISFSAGRIIFFLEEEKLS